MRRRRRPASPPVDDLDRHRRGIHAIGGSRAAFQEFVGAERARLAEIVKAAGMRED